MSGIFSEQLTFTQENGPDVRLVVIGDENYARYETPDGYTVIYDTDLGLFTYAKVVDGYFVSSGVPMNAAAPTNTPRHLQEAETVRQEEYNRQRLLRQAPEPELMSITGPGDPSDIALTLGTNNGLLSGRRVSTGNVRGLTVIVEFQDVTTTITRQDVEELLNGTNYTRNGNFCSAREYFALVSSNKLTYTNVVIGPLRLSQNQQHYVQNLLVDEALNLVAASGVDIGQFDSRNEGIIDAVNFLYAGRSRYEKQLWPHNGFRDVQVGTKRTNFYLLTGLGNGAGDLSIGTFCHENGHLLCRFPDMYDYGNRDGDGVASAGIGSYCLMGAGNHLNSGRTPSPVCGYLRELAGWCDNVVDLSQAGNREARHADYRTVHKYKTDKINEYFIVENRTRLGLDSSLPSSGLAVYHCDTLGSNEWQEGSSTRHYQCALLQADGRSDLERTTIPGDGGDLFGAIPGTAISHATTPSSRLWDNVDSLLKLSAITAPGPAINFMVGTPPTTAAQVLIGQATPGTTIPDNNTSGITSVIALAGAGATARIKAGVDITHTYIGDLEVSLINPTGQSAVIHNKQGGNQRNLVQSYDSATTPGLAALTGNPAAGNWTLRVRDLARDDVGTLNRWNIEVELGGSGAGSLPESHEANPNLDIPDNNAAGIASVLAYSSAGTARRLKLAIQIEHTYIGDLRVELFSPSGRRALIHGQTGAQANLTISLDSNAASSPLLPLVGQGILGSWILRVTDLARRDLGKLKKWSLELTPGQ
jgi:M6 family metalloprotease-like protein